MNSTQFFPPTFEKTEFTCPFCKVYATQKWSILLQASEGLYQISDMHICTCNHCNKSSYWYKEKMIVPSESPIEPAILGMPEELAKDYEEAREVFVKSPRVASALVRLLLQKLFRYLGEKGENLNDDIASLVNKGMTPEIPKYLNYFQFSEEEATHPGEITITEPIELTASLFTIINFIVLDRIVQPKEMNAFHAQLRAAAKRAIEERNEKAVNREKRSSIQR